MALKNGRTMPENARSVWATGFKNNPEKQTNQQYQNENQLLGAQGQGTQTVVVWG